MTGPITNTRPGHVEAVLSDVVHRRKTGAWPEGKVPRWASEYAAQLGTKVGSSKFDDALDRWYVAELEATLQPFASAGAALNPRTDAGGTAVTVQDEAGRRHIVTYGQLRQAARLLGEGLRKLQDRAEILKRFALVDGGVLFQIRWQPAYAEKPRWLLLRETALADGSRKLQALGYGGKILSTRVFQPGAEDADLSVRISSVLSAPLLADAGRLDALRGVARTGDLKSGRASGDAYDTQVSNDAKERRYRRLWSVVSDIHVNVGGLPGNRLIRLRWTDAPVRSSYITGDKTESDLVLSIGADGEAKVLYGNSPWRPKPGEPAWRVASFVFQPDNANKLLAGIAAGSTRMIAEAVDVISDTAWMNQPEADRVMAAAQASKGE
jgi:hypothetical protein